MFVCEFCGIFRNTFFTEHLWTTAFDFQDLEKSLSYTLKFYVIKIFKQKHGKCKLKVYSYKIITYTIIRSTSFM